MRRLTWNWQVPAVMLACLLACHRSHAPGADSSTETQAEGESSLPITALQRDGLHNLLQLNDRLYSGGQPEGNEGFASLADLGIKTVVSVDGAKPDLELARRHGLRYVHIPVGYDTVSSHASKSLTRLMRDVDGSIYIHCHHGKHRGPTAAALACLASGEASRTEAVAILKRAGTSPKYPGLWKAVNEFVRPAPESILPDLVSVAAVNSFTQSMANIDRAYDDLSLCHDTGWKPPDSDPDLSPTAQAVLLAEAFRESARRGEEERLPSEVIEGLRVAERMALSLEEALHAGNLKDANAHFNDIKQSCSRCHAQHRDGVPD
ncbi:Beta-lactamase hydrolase-like protein [Planctomycetes bacterium Pan216]|uniref:Beta-lactamase hydrolase-like protein n=1 Tax=Kolteria novifilia TaxID=2527975 RepID=A0A518B6B0_9BACT|nr:Beta-lactamase hydrolase-like protein [Planctomycetes bacterium Pan216]